MVSTHVTTKALLLDDHGRVLLLHDQGSSDGQHHEHWDVPGGRKEEGETLKECLIREVQEETGIELDEADMRTIYHTSWRLNSRGRNEHVVGLFYVVDVGKRQVVLSDEHQDFVWHDLRNALPVSTNNSVCEALDRLKMERFVPEADTRIKGHQGYGLIQLIHGHGKGKTTAALGQAIRCAGSGRRVGIVYFDKGGSDHYHERAMLDQIDSIDYIVTGRDRIDAVTKQFDFSITEKDISEAERGLNEAMRMLQSAEYDLVILDEICSTEHLGMLKVDTILQALANKADTTEVILTGRDPHNQLLEAAHLVTRAELERHYFYSGVQAREGLDY